MQIITGISKQEWIKMYQISFFSTCNIFSWWVFISWLVVKNIKCSPSNLKPAQILLQGCDSQCHKGQQCPQRGLGRISELSYLALGTQASQGMASSDKQAIPFVCTLHTKSLWAKFELQQQGWNALMCSVLEGALGQRQSLFFFVLDWPLKNIENFTISENHKPSQKEIKKCREYFCC